MSGRPNRGIGGTGFKKPGNKGGKEQYCGGGSVKTPRTKSGKK